MPAATWLEKLKCRPNYFKEGKWKPFAISYAYICRRMFTLLLFKEDVPVSGSQLLPNFLTYHAHQNPELSYLSCCLQNVD